MPKITRQEVEQVAKNLGVRRSTRRLPGYNFMTPEEVGTYTKNKITFELSLGEWMGDSMVGVTFFDEYNQFSKSVFSLADAELLIKKVLIGVGNVHSTLLNS